MLLEREPGAERRQPVLALSVAGALAVAALAANVGRVAETPQGGRIPALAAIGPGKLGQLRAIQLDPQGRIPVGTEQLGRAALAGAPLSYEPFFAVATGGFRDARSAGSEGDARLLREALRRNPRSREARVFLLRHAVGTGNLSGAIDQIASLNRLGSASGQLMSAVGRAISTPKLCDEAARALAPHPELFAAFLRGFSDAPKPRELAVRMMDSLPPSAMRDPEVRRLAVKQLVGAGAFAEARRLWGSGTGSTALVHSPDFADAAALPPFNWELVADETGAAERVKGGGVAVDYFGRHPGPLVSQLVTLTPGSWAAKIVYRSESGKGGVTDLQVSCAGSERLLLDKPLDAANGVNQALTVSFTVPADCPGQVLAVAGRPVDTRDSQQLTVRSITVERAGR